MNIYELRRIIDEIDDKLVPLLVKRMEISKAVAEYKLENGLPIFSEEREKEILQSVAEKSGDYENALKKVYASVMEASKDVQNEYINSKKD